MALTALPFTYSKFPLKILNKGPEFFKLQVENQEQQKPRKTAAELLAESRHRYVKSVVENSAKQNGRQGDVQTYEVSEQENKTYSSRYETVIFTPTKLQSHNLDVVNQTTQPANAQNIRTTQQNQGEKATVSDKPPVPKKPTVNLLNPKLKDFHSRDASFDSGVYPHSGANPMKNGPLQATTQETQTELRRGNPLNGQQSSRYVNTNNGLQIKHVKSKSAPVTNSEHVSKMVNLFNKMHSEDQTDGVEKPNDDRYFSYHSPTEKNTEANYEVTDANQNTLRPKSPCARRCGRRHHTVSGDPAGSPRKIQREFENRESETTARVARSEIHDIHHGNAQVTEHRPTQQSQSDRYGTFPKSPRSNKHEFQQYSPRRNSIGKTTHLTMRDTNAVGNENPSSALTYTNTGNSNIGSFSNKRFSKSQNAINDPDHDNNRIITNPANYEIHDARHSHQSPLVTRKSSVPENSLRQEMTAKSPHLEKKVPSDLPRKSPVAQRHCFKATPLNTTPTKRIETQKNNRGDRKSPLESQLLSLLLTEFEYKREVVGKVTPVSDAGFDSKGDSLKWSSTYHSDKSVTENELEDEQCPRDRSPVSVKDRAVLERTFQPQYETHTSYVPDYRKYFKSEENLLANATQNVQAYAYIDRYKYSRPCVDDCDVSYHSAESSIQHKLHRSKSDVSYKFSKSSFGSEQEKFFTTMGMDYSVIANPKWAATGEIFHMMHGPRDRSSVSGDSHWRDISWRSDESNKGPFHLGFPDRLPDISQSVVMKNARIIKWLCECRKARSRSLSIS